MMLGTKTITTRLTGAQADPHTASGLPNPLGCHDAAPRTKQKETEMKLVGIGFLLPCIAFAQAQTFQNDRCDFSVVFPIPYETKLIVKGQDEGILATARPKKSVKLSAECWPRENISTRDFMHHIQNGAQSQGVEVTAVTAEKHSTGDVVTLVGRANTPGQLIHLRIVSYFGPKNRMDLRIIDYDFSGSREQLDFRNSVKPTNQTAANSSKNSIHKDASENRQQTTTGSIFLSCTLSSALGAKNAYTFEFNPSKNYLLWIEGTKKLDIIQNTDSQLWGVHDGHYHPFVYDRTSFQLNRASGNVEIFYSRKPTLDEIFNCKKGHNFGCDSWFVLTEHTETGVCKRQER